jgi:hypothetical protein
MIIDQIIDPGAAGELDLGYCIGSKLRRNQSPRRILFVPRLLRLPQRPSSPIT